MEEIHVQPDVIKAHQEKAHKAIHKLGEIASDADDEIDYTSMDNLLYQLQRGIFLQGKTQKYWIDKMLGNCFMLYARNLSIIWSEDEHYWKWEVESDHVSVARLLRVCWLHVEGKFDTQKLSPETLYEVAFEVKRDDEAYGWTVLLNIELLFLPGKTKQKRKEDVMKWKNKWTQITVGKFRTSPDDVKEIKFSMYIHDTWWKGGISIRGVLIQPVQLY